MFNNEEALKPIREARAEFEKQKISDDFVKALFLQAPKDFPAWAKKNYLIDQLISELETLNTNMMESVNDLSRENARMQRLYVASQQTTSK